jgi:hypothetical protein
MFFENIAKMIVVQYNSHLGKKILLRYIFKINRFLFFLYIKTTYKMMMVNKFKNMKK